jgi:hypothetical protein
MFCLILNKTWPTYEELGDILKVKEEEIDTQT